MCHGWKIPDFSLNDTVRGEQVRRIPVPHVKLWRRQRAAAARARPGRPVRGGNDQLPVPAHERALPSAEGLGHDTVNRALGRWTI